MCAQEGNIVEGNIVEGEGKTTNCNFTNRVYKHTHRISTPTWLMLTIFHDIERGGSAGGG